MMNLRLNYFLAVFESCLRWLYLGLFYEPRIYQRLLLLDSAVLRLILDQRLLFITLSCYYNFLVLLLFLLLLLLKLKHVLLASPFLFSLILRF